MNNKTNFFTNNEIEDMGGVDIESLVASRLEDLAERVAFHAFRGEWDTVELLKAEGLELAEAYDEGFNFFYVNDLTNR
jgi:hypothetical protein